ncbi:uncharacterized protein N7459_008205 [Penicillium hispanicum]|uniref:uncharacterized protein n=1 Tax=Penicillium hispanicum TaxID=1080232 RepID=UPI0025420075|nr:uncharacterized protein N7459_008205 [Penicillium hispanicum]KAJ5573778.1 hypothetical protein N7459_008205 [Penicillium hispanicum]
MDATDQSPPANALSPLTNVPIAQLSPTLEDTEAKCVDATVTLVWPYSSSTKSLSLLLAEPDFRLRRSHGQVKAIFHGRVAEKVAGSQVGISDIVRLGLKGAVFVVNSSAAQTPGRNVAWDVHFDDDNGVSLEVRQSSKNASSIIVQHHDFAPHLSELPPPSTPRAASIDPEIARAPGKGTWASPAFLKTSSQTYPGIIGNSYDPFAEEDGYVPGKGRKRPRYSLKRDDWHVLDEPLSPRQEDSTPKTWEEASSEDLNVDSDEESTTGTVPDDAVAETSSIREHVSRDRSPVFVKPSLQLAGNISSGRAPQSSTVHAESIGASPHDRFKAATNLPTDTPQLRPIPSTGLPVPSPIVPTQHNAQGYFSQPHTSQTPDAQFFSSNVMTGDETHASKSLAPSAPASQPQPLPPHPDEVDIMSQEGTPISIPAAPAFRHLPPTCSSESQIVEMSKRYPTNLAESTDSPQAPDHHQMILSEMEIEDIDALHARTAPEELDTHFQEMESYDGNVNRSEDREIISSREEGSSAFGFAQSNAQEADSLQPHGGVDHFTTVKMDTLADDSEEISSEDKVSEDEALGVSATVEEGDGRQPRPDYSENESDLADEEVHYDDDARAEFDWQDEDEEEIEDEEGIESRDESDDDSEPVDLPRPPTAQPEIIVLDSDSEDELVSDNLLVAPPVRQENRHDSRSSVSPKVENSTADESHEERSIMSEEDDGHETTEPGILYQDDRVHESDMDDESPVNFLARDNYSDRPSLRESSPEEDIGDFTRGRVGETPSDDQHTDERIRTEAEKQAIIELDSDEEEPSEDDEDVPQESGPERAQHGRQRSSGHSEKPFNSLDGTNDQGWPRFAAQAATDDKTSQREELLGSGNFSDQGRQSPKLDDQYADQVSLDILEPTRIKDAEQQLLTPDPTQEAVSGHQRSLLHANTKLSPSPSARGSPVGLNVSLSSAPGDVSIAQELVFSERSVDDPIHGELSTVKHAEAQEKPSEVAGEDAPETPKVLIVKPPVPDRLAQGLRSKLSYFAPLATLIDHYNALVDTISIVHDTSTISRAESGSRDYFMTIQLTDPSMAGTTLQAQIFRRYRSVMPLLAEGDAILLRDFKVRTYDHDVVLVSVEASSWAVFNGSGPEAQVNGPPVEYNSEERAFASALRRWHSQVGASMVADRQLQVSIERDSMEAREPTPESVVLSETGSLDSISRGDTFHSSRSSRRSRRSHRRVTIHELRDGRRYTEVGSPSSKESIHELRDGTVYANL